MIKIKINNNKIIKLIKCKIIMKNNQKIKINSSKPVKILFKVNKYHKNFKFKIITLIINKFYRVILMKITYNLKTLYYNKNQKFNQRNMILKLWFQNVYNFGLLFIKR